MVNETVNQIINQVASIGRGALATLYPNDFDYYMVALELTDSNNNTIDYLTFPVMPDSIQKTEPTRTNIKKTLSGITVLSNPSFTPQEINLKGSFGRNFKILLNTKTPVQGVAFSTNAGKYDLYSISGAKTSLSLTIGGIPFNVGIKNGYGVMKILKAMASKSVGLDKNGRPMKLIFYNMALGENYLVVIPPSGVIFTQDLSKNMIWNYNLTMIAVAPLEATLEERKTNSKMSLISSAVSAAVNFTAKEIEKAIL